MDWISILSAFFAGCIGFSVCTAIYFYGKKRWMKRHHEAWMDKVQYFSFELVRARLDTALCEMRLAEEIGKMPEQFEPAVLLAARVGYAVERAVVQKAQELGLTVPKQLQAIEPQAIAIPVQEPKYEKIAETEVVDPKQLQTEWHDGRLVPRRPRLVK